MFNFEGGCYAKTIRLSAEAEPEIWQAAHAYGTVLENVAIDENGVTDLDDASKTENTRAAYKLELIANALPAKRAGHPSTVIFLTADAFGILPPIARLSREQALYYFLSGFTAKLAGTEIGVTEPQPTFSTCFGQPFLPQPPQVYAGMLGAKLDEHGAKVWLVNTGWTGGPGRRGRADADPGDPGDAARRARRPRSTAPSSAPTRCSASRCRSQVPGVDTRPARPARDLGRPGRLRPQGRELAAHVRRQLRALRRRRRHPARRPASMSRQKPRPVIWKPRYPTRVMRERAWAERRPCPRAGRRRGPRRPRLLARLRRRFR